MQLILIEVASRDAGLDALDRLDEAVATGKIDVEDAALVYKNDKGKVKIHQTRDASAKVGGFWGGAVGLLVGLVAAPAVIAATAVGAGGGALLAKARDHGVSDSMMKQIGNLIEGSEAAVMILADDASAAAITGRLDELIAEGAEYDYAMMPPEAQDFLKETIKLGMAS